MSQIPHELINETQDVAQTIQEVWSALTHDEKLEKFKAMSRSDAEDLFISLNPTDQAEIFHDLTPLEKRSWIRLLAPDDTADLIQKLTDEERYQALSLLDDVHRKEVTALLAYAEDDAGGLMSSRFIRLRPDMSVDEAVRYIRVQAKTPVETIYYGYVLDSEQKLLGAVSFRELLLSSPDKQVKEIMITDLITIPEDMDQEEVSRRLYKNNLMALPVVDQTNRMKGIVTVDDVVDVVKEEATEDIQKLGGMEAMEAPYFNVDFWTMIKKRGGWLSILFLGELLTANAMSYYEHELQAAIVLAMFIPLIISSGGNSGSQASTLIIRAIALNEVRLRDWWRILFRELRIGLILGLLLASLGFLRVLLWPNRAADYGEHYMQLGLAVFVSVLGVVTWGVVAGSMLPLILKKLKFDPASASTPFVATLVDVTGLIIYFSVANVTLSGAYL